MTHNHPKWTTCTPRFLILALAALLAVVVTAFAGSGFDRPQTDRSPECATGVDFLGFSDALDKQTYEGTSVGWLSALTYDQRRGVYYSLVDNGPAAASEARFYTLRLPTSGGTLGEPQILDVTTLRKADGQPFTASDFDGEGLTLTREDYLLVSSETEPSIRRFSLDGTFWKNCWYPRNSCSRRTDRPPPTRPSRASL